MFRAHSSQLLAQRTLCTCFNFTERTSLCEQGLLNQLEMFPHLEARQISAHTNGALSPGSHFPMTFPLSFLKIQVPFIEKNDQLNMLYKLGQPVVFV